MTCLLLVMGLFLLGVVILVDHAVGSLSSNQGSDELTLKGEQLLDRIETLVRDARSITIFAGAEPLRLEIKSDLDGDSRTGSFEVDGARGLEQVIVTQASRGDQRLVATVLSDSSHAGRTVVLTSLLDTHSDEPFKAVPVATEEREKEYYYSDALADYLDITVVLSDQGRARKFTRSIPLEHKPPALWVE